MRLCRRLSLGLGSVAALAAFLATAPAALAAPGDLDPSFSGDGWATLVRGPEIIRFEDVAAAPGGKVVAAAAVTLHGGQSEVLVARYRPNGSLDSTFGLDGAVELPVRGCLACAAAAVSVDKQGRVVLLGLTGGPTGRAGSERAVLARFDRRGARDRSFGKGGIVRLPRSLANAVSRLVTPPSDIMASPGRALALGPRGSIFVLGCGPRRSGSRGTSWCYRSDQRTLVAGYRANGRRKSSFGRRGIATIAKDHFVPAALTVGARGRVIVAGKAQRRAATRFAALRLRANGKLDRSFSRDGLATLGLGPGLALESVGAAATTSGQGIALGGAAVCNGAGTGGCYRLAVARFRHNGKPDRGFSGSGPETTGGPGTAATGFGFPGEGAGESAEETLPDLTFDRGELIVVGSVGREFADGRIALARYLPDGQLDPGFGADGRVTTAFGSGSSVACVAPAAEALLRGERLAVAGFTYNCDEDEEGTTEGSGPGAVLAVYER